MDLHKVLSIEMFSSNGSYSENQIDNHTWSERERERERERGGRDYEEERVCTDGQTYHHVSTGGVETRGRLVQKEQQGVVDDVDSYGNASSLATRHTTTSFIADDGVGHLHQAQLIQQVHYSSPFLGCGLSPRHSKKRGKHQRFLHCQHGKQQIVL